MPDVPGQRRAGQTGGHGGQRSNRGTFRNAGGSVPPKKTGTSNMVVAAIAAPVIAAVGYILIPLL